MNPAIIAQLVLVSLEIWRNHANKPPEWTPTPEDWAALEADVAKYPTAQAFKDEAAGVIDHGSKESRPTA